MLRVAACSAVVLAGCAEGEPAAEQIIFDICFAEKAVTFMMTDAAMKSTWEVGDQVGIFAAAGAVATSDYYIQNARLTWDGAKWLPDTPIYWPADGELSMFVYYPYNPRALDFRDIATGVAGDQSGEGYGDSDLLTNGGFRHVVKGAAVGVPMAHALAMVQVTVKNTELLPDADAITVKLKGVYEGVGIVGTPEHLAAEVADGTRGDIVMHRVEGAGFIFRALVPAGQTFAAGVQMFEITDGANTFLSEPLSGDCSLEAGRAEIFRHSLGI